MSSDKTGGTGSRLPPTVLTLASISAGFATLLSIWCIVRQLKHYRKPLLQRYVVRILFMVPIYSISSLVSLYSLEAAFFIDAVRDIYEAFVIYCFFSLLVEYLGGERSLIILLHGRNPTSHPWPVKRFLQPMDISDPYTFLALKRGILQYVQVKPVLAILTMVFKATGTYRDGSLTGDSGYTYVSIGYNLSVSLSLYCLAMFWVCTGADLQPFRFWQGFMISILVATGLLVSDSYDSETLSVAVQDTLICFEMPLFAILHIYAFSHKDYEDKTLQYTGRLPFYWAFQDSILGFKDVLEDSLTTLKGTGFSYRTFEPAEGALHQGPARDRRVRAGLRYSKGGKAKYWLPMPGQTEAEAYGQQEEPTGFKKRLADMAQAYRSKTQAEQGYAPITPEQARDVVHRDPRELEAGDAQTGEAVGRWDVGRFGVEEALEGVLRDAEYDSEEEGRSIDVGFGESDVEGDDQLYQDARRLEFGDYNNPVVDASREEARRVMREYEDNLIAGRPSKSFHRGDSKGKGKLTQTKPSRPKHSLLHNTTPPSSPERKPNTSKTKAQAAEEELPEGCVDLLVEDHEAEHDHLAQERLKGEANMRGEAARRVYRRLHPEFGPPAGEVSYDAKGRKVEQVEVEDSPPQPGRVEIVDEAADVRGTQSEESIGGGSEPDGLKKEGNAVETDKPKWAHLDPVVGEDGSNPWD